MSTQLAAPATAYAELLQQIRDLTRDHLVAYRVELGRLLLARFFAGSPEMYRDQDPGKDASFLAFFTASREELALFGLGERTLRNCIGLSVA